MDRVKEFVATYGPYLEDIRGRLYKTTIFFAVMFFVGFSFSGSIMTAMIRLFDIPDVMVATTSPFQLASLSMDIGLFCAMTLTMPILAYHIFIFSSKALSSREKRRIFIYAPVSLVLFLVGFSYAFFILYYSFSLLARFGGAVGVRNIWDIGQFISQTYTTALILGIVFQVPLVLTALIRLRLMDVDFLRKKRRIAYVLVVIMVSLLPPTDGLSLIVMSLPLILLFEASIFINRNIKKHV